MTPQQAIDFVEAYMLRGDRPPFDLGEVVRVLRETVAGGWVACGERMPDTDKRVHVVYSSFGGPRVIIAVRETEAQNGESDGWRADGGGWYDANCVTHWHALPIPPRAEPLAKTEGA